MTERYTYLGASGDCEMVKKLLFIKNNLNDFELNARMRAKPLTPNIKQDQPIFSLKLKLENITSEWCTISQSH